MAADNNNMESNYKKLVNSLYQYLSEPIKDFASVKPEIINILKTHRPIRVVAYQYGISSSLKGRSRLIIHEFNDRSMVREYFKSGKNVWHCCECNRTAASEANESGINDILIQHGIVFVKNEHDCKPRQLSFVKQIQKLYQEKKTDEVISLQKSVLGSEDSNMCLNKSAVRKRGKRMFVNFWALRNHFLEASSKYAEVDLEIASLISLRCVQQTQEVFSILDEELNENRKTFT